MHMETVVTVVGIGLVFFCLTMWAFIDCALKNFESIQQKAVWGLIALIPFLGWIIYFLFGAKKGQRPGQTL